MGEQPNRDPTYIKELLKQNPEYVEKREQLKKDIEDAAWESATNVIDVYIEAGRIAEAERQAQEAINNWEEEGKTDIISDFKIWLKSKNIDLDKE